jgi:hypothetical protein
MAADTFMEFNASSIALYDKYGVDEAPTATCTWSTRKKTQFFVEALQLYDSGSDTNKNLPLPTKLFMNRRYNNTYVHLINTFPGEVVDKVHQECRRRGIGDAFRAQAKEYGLGI